MSKIIKFSVVATVQHVCLKKAAVSLARKMHSVALFDVTYFALSCVVMKMTTRTSSFNLTRGCVSFFRNVNIFSGRSRRVSLAGVSPELNVIPTALPTTPPPTLPPPTCGNPYPPLRNSSAEDEVRLEGTDYIAFYATADVLNYTQNR